MYSIGEFSRIMRLTVKALRYYDEQGVFGWTRDALRRKKPGLPIERARPETFEEGIHGALSPPTA